MGLSVFNEAQPAPEQSTSEAVWPTIFTNENFALPEWLVADMRERNELGSARYGTPLRVWNGRDAVIDAYQEALDLIVYVQQARSRLGVLSLRQRTPSSDLSSNINVRLTLDLAFHNALQTARHLGEIARLKAVPTHPRPGVLR